MHTLFTRAASRYLAPLIGALAFTACFSPSYPVDLACGPDNFCPPGQACSIDQICLLIPASSDDADADTAADAPLGLGELKSIDIGPDLSLTLAETHTFVVTATYEMGTRVENNALVIWRSSSTATVFVDFQGVARPQTLGTVSVRADFNGGVDSVDVTVVP